MCEFSLCFPAGTQTARACESHMRCRSTSSLLFQDSLFCRTAHLKFIDGRRGCRADKTAGTNRHVPRVAKGNVDDIIGLQLHIRLFSLLHGTDLQWKFHMTPIGLFTDEPRMGWDRGWRCSSCKRDCLEHR